MWTVRQTNIYHAELTYSNLSEPRSLTCISLIFTVWQGRYVVLLLLLVLVGIPI